MKKMIAALLAVMMVATLAACGSGAQNKTVDVAALADALAQGVQFDSEMDTMAVETINYTLDVPEGATAAGYESVDATSEQIIAVQCADADAAAAVQVVAQTYLNDLKTEAEKYQPEERVRLDGAILKLSGNVVVLCVTSDTENANAIIGEYLG